MVELGLQREYSGMKRDLPFSAKDRAHESLGDESMYGRGER